MSVRTPKLPTCKGFAPETEAAGEHLLLYAGKAAQRIDGLLCETHPLHKPVTLLEKQEQVGGAYLS